MALNVYFKKPSFEKKSEKSLAEQGIDTSSYEAILGSTRKKIQDIEKELLDREKEIEKMR